MFGGAKGTNPHPRQSQVMIPAGSRHTTPLQPLPLLLVDMFICQHLPQFHIQHTRPFKPPFQVLQHNGLFKSLTLQQRRRVRCQHIPPLPIVADYRLQRIALTGFIERELAHVRRHPRGKQRGRLICQGVKVDFCLGAGFNDERTGAHNACVAGDLVVRFKVPEDFFPRGFGARHGTRHLGKERRLAKHRASASLLDRRSGGNGRERRRGSPRRTLNRSGNRPVLPLHPSGQDALRSKLK